MAFAGPLKGGKNGVRQASSAEVKNDGALLPVNRIFFRGIGLNELSTGKINH
jgi:hypothetical protein